MSKPKAKTNARTKVKIKSKKVKDKIHGGIFHNYRPVFPPKLQLTLEKYRAKLEKIKVFAMDVDGILTNGLIYYSGQEIGFNRYFHVLDGYILIVLQNAGIKVSVISGGESIGLSKRIEILQLNPKYIFLGNQDKRMAYLKLKAASKCKDEEILYLGDELFDIPILRRVGFSATVPHAGLEVKSVVDYVTATPGGQGAVREVADLLRYVQGIYPPIPDFN